MSKLAVVVLNWNGAAMLERYLPSVTSFSNLKGVSVWVADNGSTDDSVELVKSKFPSVYLLELEDNYGFAEGYNRAIRKIAAEYIVLLNSDVEVSEHWLEPMIHYLDQNPEVAACQPKIKSWHNKDYFEYAGACGGFIDQWGYPFCRGRVMDILEEDTGQYDSIIPVFWASGAALCIRREVYLEVGGLDPRFFAHMEEIDLCWRLASRGHSLVVLPESIVYHLGGATLKKSNPKKTFLNFRNNLLMMYKNLPDKKLKKVMRMRYLLDNMAILFFILKGQTNYAKAVRSARKEFKEMKPLFESDRQNNLDLAIAEPKGVMKSSLIWQYYLKGKTKFTELTKNINI